MNSRILAFAGTKQSGKTTCSNFLHGYQLRCHHIVDNFTITKDGQLIVTTTSVNENGGEEQGNVLIDVSRSDLEFAEWAAYSMWPFIKKYSFAAPLKEIATGLFGLRNEQVYGTEQQKNTLTNIKWGDIPTPNKKKKNKKMTAREFLQYFGTDVCRSMYEDVWVDRCIKDIEYEQPLLAIVDDCRFPNEADAIQKAGGKVIKLTRSIYEDKHSSETALDDWDNFDAVIDSENLEIHEMCQSLIETLNSWGWIGSEIPKPEVNDDLRKQIEEEQVPAKELVGGIHTIKEVEAE